MTRRRSYEIKPRTDTRKPSHTLRVFNKETRKGETVGVGWVNDDGSIGIKLNGCVVLAANDQDRFGLYLFKADNAPWRLPPADEAPSQPPPEMPPERPAGAGEDIPF